MNRRESQKFPTLAKPIPSPLPISTTSTKTKRNPTGEEETFGSLLPGRNSSSNSYRYGFNSKENDNEWNNSTGSWQDYGMRMYDPRLGRFCSVDPLTAAYPWYTPFQFAGNKPIWAIDLDGLEEVPQGSEEPDYTIAPRDNRLPKPSDIDLPEHNGNYEGDKYRNWGVGNALDAKIAAGMGGVMDSKQWFWDPNMFYPGNSQRGAFTWEKLDPLATKVPVNPFGNPIFSHIEYMPIKLTPINIPLLTSNPQFRPLLTLPGIAGQNAAIGRPANFNLLLTFIAQTNQFANIGNVTNQLLPFVNLLLSDPSRVLSIRPNVFTGGPQGGGPQALNLNGMILNGQPVNVRTLMLARGNAIRNMLIAMGVPANQVISGTGQVINNPTGLNTNFRLGSVRLPSPDRTGLANRRN